MRPTPPAADAALRALAEADAVRPMDLAFGRWLAGLDPERGEALALTGALLARARLAGHSHVELDAWAGHPFPNETSAEPAAPLPRLPEQGTWRTLLEASPLVGAPGEAAPLVLDGDALYLYRYWRAERRVAERLARRLQAPAPLAPAASLRARFTELFPPASNGTLDAQALAAAAALRQPLAVIAGGPGTGKTTTVARLLALLLQARPDLRVALAAPTGKAAQRLSASIAFQLDALGLDADARARIPEAQTLHRLLRASPDGRFGRSAESPVPADLLIVDETSMVDLLLMDALLDALPETTRLVLLGDADQLDSVEAGAVFGDLCRLGGTPSPAFAGFCRDLGLEGVPEDAAALPPADAVVTLWKSHRFDPDAGIGALAAALREGDADRALAVLDDAGTPEATLAPGSPKEALNRVLPHARAVVQSATPEEALEALGRFQLLALTRHGPAGVKALNAAVEAVLRREDRIVPASYYRGRPVLVTANDYGVGLFNGDLGVAWPADGHPAVVFPDGQGGLRTVPAVRLPPHESAWAMTVHKSQGSEFDAVTVLLPSEATPLLTRELLYTAVTRARSSASVLGAPAQVRHAATHASRRHSRLGALLAAHAPAA